MTEHQRQLLRCVRDSNLLVTTVTDIEQRTVSVQDAKWLERLDVCECVRKEVAKEFRVSGKYRYFMAVTEQGRYEIDRMLGNYRRDGRLPNIGTLRTEEEVEQHLMNIECYRNAKPVERTKIKRLLAHTVHMYNQFLEVLSSFDSVDKFIDYIEGKS